MKEKTSMQTIYASERIFQLFSYGVTHGQLLFRSCKTDTDPTRVDILFQEVRATELRSWFEGIEIVEEDNSTFLAGRPSRPVPMFDKEIRFYRLKGTGWEGFVVGGIVSCLEDDGDFFDPSGLIEDTIRTPVVPA
jgi:hypothetical protein